MVFAVSSDMIWASTLGISLFFTFLGSYWPLRVARGEVVTGGMVWGYLRVTIFPIIASISWYLMAAFSVANGAPTQYTLYYFFLMLFFIYIVVGIVMVFYMAFHPLIDVLEGRDSLENS